MINFNLSIPTEIVFGKGVLSSLGEKARIYGTRALLVYGKESIKRSGLYDRLIKVLSETGVEVVDYGGVVPNPRVSHARLGIQRAKEGKVDLVIGVGGGSVIDESKAIAAGAVSDADIWDFFMRREKITKALPIIAVMTMPATSSEMNKWSVLTEDEDKLKLGVDSDLFYPRVSYLDPELTYTIPIKNTAYACTDILSHMFETYFNSKEVFNPVNEGMIEGNCRAIIKSMDRILINPTDYDARASIMWGATMAWNGFLSAGVEGVKTPCHKLEHPISEIYDIAHGAGLSIIIPAWLNFVRDRIPERITQFAENILGITKGTTDEKIDRAIDDLKTWYRKIGTPTTFGEAGLENPNLGKMADHVLIALDLFKMNDFTREEIIGIYSSCL